MSATKSEALDLSNLIELHKRRGNLPNKFSHMIYTSETAPQVKKQTLSDVETYWKDLNLVIYSPTISAGTSYNVSDKFGFDELYVYLKSKGGASFNTLNQMLFRIRQLKDKEFHIFYQKEKDSYHIDEDNLESQMLKNSETIFDTFGKPCCEKPFELDQKYKPVFNTEHWSYTMWMETVYNTCHYAKSYNFKKGIISELCNNPKDLNYAGRGMKLIDHSLIQENIELSEIEKVSNIALETTQFLDLDTILPTDITKIENGEILEDIVYKQYHKYKLGLDLKLNYTAFKELDKETKINLYKNLKEFKTKEVLFRQRDFYNDSIDIKQLSVAFKLTNF